MIETEEVHTRQQEIKDVSKTPFLARWQTHALQVVRFGLVGGVNTGLDLLALNALLLLLPTNRIWLILASNISKVLAISVSASLSFLGMRLWVFVQKP